MNMQNFFTKTFYQKRSFTAWWSIGLAVMILVTMAFFPSLSKGDMAKSFSELPSALQNVVGDALSFTALGGYINQQLFALRMPMLTIVMSVVLFVGLTVGDEQRGLLETQLTLPVSRTRLALQKLLAGVAVMIMGAFAMVAAVVASVFMVSGHYPFLNILQAALGCMLLSIDFGLIAAAVALATGRKGFAIGLASVLAFGGYLLTSIGVLVKGLDTVEKLSLFHYYQSNGAVTAHNMVVLGVVGIAVTAIGLVLFARRDLKV